MSSTEEVLIVNLQRVYEHKANRGASSEITLSPGITFNTRVILPGAGPSVSPSVALDHKATDTILERKFEDLERTNHKIGYTDVYDAL